MYLGYPFDVISGRFRFVSLTNKSFLGKNWKFPKNQIYGALLILYHQRAMLYFIICRH